MTTWYSAPVYQHEVLRIRVIWVAVVLSLLIHVATLWEWTPRLLPVTFENPVPGQTNNVIVAQLAQRPSPPASSSSTPSPIATPPAKSAQVPRALSRPVPERPATPPVITAPSPSPAPVIVAPPAQPAPPTAPPTPPPVATPSAPPPIAGDLTTYIEARRRARGEASSSPVDGSVRNAPPAPENDIERRNRIVAANLGLSNTPTVGGSHKDSGGIFHIERLGYNDAEFMFHGWNNDINRKSQQRIEVRKGEHSDIRFAVIRKMIAIIREHESGDFMWVSPRLGRTLTLSARISDNKELEAFMMKEFFAEWRPEVGAR